jgi:tetratricopeptide (TPR) repeat protein
MPKIVWYSFVSICAWGLLVQLSGCGSSAEKFADVRRASQQAHDEGLASLQAKDYALAEKHFTTAIELRGLNPDFLADALIRRAICWGATGKVEEASAELQKLESSGIAADQIYAARSYVLAKQGKAAESRAALAKARQFNRSVQEFKD